MAPVRIFCCYIFIILPINNAARIKRIVNGNYAHPSQAPYYVKITSSTFIDVNCTYTYNWLCGGTLISGRHVLTAAHCIMRYCATQNFHIQLMKNYWFPNFHIWPPQPQLKFTTRDVVQHEDFNVATLAYDIGFVRLPLDVSRYFDGLYYSLVGLPTISDFWTRDYNLETGQVCGFGRTMYEWYNIGPTSQHLMCANVTVINAQCPLFNITLTNSELCIGGVSRTEGRTASGDSGGGFVINNRIVGIVSGAYDRSVPFAPLVYIKVARFIYWIANKTGIILTY